MKKITVIGAGTMGNGIAHTFAQKNFNVNLVDVSENALNKALSTIEKNLDRMVKKEKITKDEKTETLNNITTHTNINNAVKGVDLVVEATTENMDLKIKIFKDLDNICDSETILATNTSSISIQKLQLLQNEQIK